MRDETTIYYDTHKHMRLYKQVQPYMVQAGVLYISYLDHIKLN